MTNLGPRIQREQNTVATMIQMWCHAHHDTNHALCDDCTNLLTYAHARLAHCQFGETKSTCASCPVHCYQATRRDQIRSVMRWAGPRMMLQHPLMAIRHVLDAKKPTSP